MPLYQYHCDNCQEVVEIFKKFASINTEELCPECGQPMEKSVSSSNFVLKGSGWARDQYGK